MGDEMGPEIGNEMRPEIRPEISRTAREEGDETWVQALFLPDTPSPLTFW